MARRVISDLALCWLHLQSTTFREVSFVRAAAIWPEGLLPPTQGRGHLLAHSNGLGEQPIHTGNQRGEVMQRHVTRHSETSCNRCSRSTPPFGVRCATVIGECPRTGAFRVRLGRLGCGGSFVVHPPDVLAPSAVILHEAHRTLEHTFPSNIADDATVHARRGGRHTRTDELIFYTNSSPSVVWAWHRTWMYSRGLS